MRRIWSLLLGFGIMGSLAILLAGGASYDLPESSPPPALDPPPFVLKNFIKGISWVGGRRAIPDDALPNAKDHGVQWIALTPFGWMENQFSTRIRVNRRASLWGEADVGLQVTTRKAHAHGLKIMLKPHIWISRPIDNGWRGEIGFSTEEDWQTWESDYRLFILHYARLAQEENIEIGIALRFGSSAATVVYEETHQLETDANGVFNLQIGDGNLINGSYASLPWGNAAFMTVSMNGVEVGTTELMAVPYAIASGDKQWVVNGSDIENKNEGEVAIQNNLRVKGGFNLSTGNQVNEISDNGTLSENSNGILPTQRAVKTYVDNRFFAGGGVEQNAGEVPYDNTVSGLTAVNAQDAIDELASAGEGADADADPTNELQNLTLTGTNLEISDGTGVDLSGIIPPGGTDDQTAAEVPFNNTGTGLVATDTQSALEELAAGGLVDTDNQDLSLSGTVLNITDGTGVDLSGIIPPGGTDDQTAAEVPFNNSGTGLAATDAQAALEELAAGGLVDTDNQGLILTGDVLSIEDGAGSIDLSNYVDVTGESGLLVGDGANISGLEGTADGQVAKWNAALGQWIAGTDEIGGGGSSLWEENGSDIYFDSGSVGVGNSAPGVESGASTYLTVATGTSPGDNALASVEIQGGQGSTNQPIGRLDFISNSSPGNSAITRIETKTAGGAQFRGDLGFFTKDGAAYGSSTLQERFTIKYNGNIGVGVTNPTEKFDVDGTIKSRDLAGVGQRNVVADANGNLVIGGSGGGSSLWSVNGTNIHFNTGNVGIGTATPSSPIEIVSINDSPILIESTRADGNGWIRFNKPSGRIGYVGMYSDNGVNDIEMGTTGNNTSGRLHLTSRGNPKLTVDDNNVGVGTTSPSAKLHINQGGQAVGTGLRFSDGINDDWDITHGFGLRFHYGGVLRGFINANNGAYVQSSDKRLKSEIELLENVLGKVKELKPKTYYYKSDISRNRTIGLIAQEVQGLFPELVSSNNEDGMLGLEYSAFAVIAIKAIQEQQTLIETQSERIMALEERLVRLEKNLSK